MTSQLTDLFDRYIATKKSVLELQDIDRKPVAAIYMDKVKVDRLVVSETNNQERYFLYIDGIGIYFSFFRLIEEN